ncbi:unnamed protein product [Thelazia callipaeda]|uniref:TSL-kinase interacting protein 1 n=1 Tax=Thelazia callipaeda TaxID=103827 RepID=A0A0N5CJC8_THECL|nr:unnamed protein product [Thelazia callipaeda]
MMLSHIGEERCSSSSLLDLVLYAESGECSGSKSVNNNYGTVLSHMKRKYCKSGNCSDDSPQKLLQTLQEKFTSLKRFRNVLILRGMFFPFHHLSTFFAVSFPSTFFCLAYRLCIEDE